MNDNEPKMLKRVRVIIDEKTGEIIEKDNERQEEDSDGRQNRIYIGQYL